MRDKIKENLRQNASTQFFPRKDQFSIIWERLHFQEAVSIDLVTFRKYLSLINNTVSSSGDNADRSASFHADKEALASLM